MSIYQEKKSGKWYFEAMIRGKRYHRAISEAVTKKDAETYFNAFKTDLLRGKLDLVENIGCKLFKDLADEYIKYSEGNHRSYKTNVAKAQKFKKLWGNRQLKDISPMDIEKYKINRKKEIKAKEKEIDGQKIEAKYISATTINRDIEVLRKMFNIAIDNGWLTKNPCTAVKKLRQENILERYLSPDEEIRMFQVCDGDFSFLKEDDRKKAEKTYKNRFKYMIPIITCALNTGMRKEEILSLTWKCVNFEDNKITLLDTKNGKKRHIPINSILKGELKTLHKSKCCDYVFANPITKNKYCDLKTSFPSICRLAKIENFRFHDLRHTSATRMVGAGVPITMVKDILGHSDIHTTMRYAHAITEQSLDAVEALSNYAERNRKVVALNPHCKKG